MIFKFVIFFSIFINICLIFLFNKKKIKSFFYKAKIEKIDVSDIHEIFKLKKISENLRGPKKDVIIKNFSISPTNKIVGMTSDQEAWIIGSLSKFSKNIFEFGTCSGKTTYIMALNSSEDAKIISLTLHPNEISQISKNINDNKISFRNIKNESIYNKFLFSGDDVEKKISVIFENSLNFDHRKYIGKIDLIFIDGGHTYSVVKNDSEKSFKMLNQNGIILWHDYVPGKTSAKDVVKYIHEISKEKKLYSIEGTSLVYFKNE